MKLREQLQRRDDVSDDDIAEIIQIAAKLQNEAAEDARALSAADVADIAEELDIDPAYVDRAIELRREERERELQAAAARARLRKRAMIGAGAAIAGISAILLVLGLIGSRSLARRHAAVDAATAMVDRVLSQQASSAAQQLATVGARSDAVTAAAAAVESGADIEARLAASRDLQQAMAAALAALPAATDESANQLRLNLHYEITGMQNRLSTETSRLNKANAAYQQEKSTITGRVAGMLGLAP